MIKKLIWRPSDKKSEMIERIYDKYIQTMKIRLQEENRRIKCRGCQNLIKYKQNISLH